MKRHINIPVFIPHLGCPNQCVFCNQRTISGVTVFEPNSVIDIIETALSTVDAETTETEIAFFGGSFTGIDRELMLRLLNIAHGYVKSGRVTSVRCSTRPDYIDDEILDILSSYSVKTVELGIQSTDDRVLSFSKRGHRLEHSKKACALIVEKGFRLVGQMMVGLPGSSLDSELETAEFIIKNGAVGARIYPTVVFKNTELCEMAERGEYIPLSLIDAVSRSACVKRKFVDSGVDVIRVGLCASENMSSENTYFAGPNHSALGELVENELYYSVIKDEILKYKVLSGEIIKVKTPEGELSKAIGQKKKNKLRLLKEFSLSNIVFSESKAVPKYSVLIER